MERFGAILAEEQVVAGQVLVTPFDFVHRAQYLHARDTLRRLLELGVIPIVNENDTVADDEIRFGDNDRIAALVANMVRAEMLVLLTDTAGVFTADPRLDADASLIEEVNAVDEALESVAGGSGSVRGSGGMASKLAAAKIASWSGVRAVIAAADQPGVLTDALGGVAVGTVVQPHAERLPSRKLWIAFAVGAEGRVVVDDGARRALVSQGRSLLAAGVRDVEGEFDGGRRGRDRRRRRSRVREGLHALRREGAARGGGTALRATCPTGRRPRSCTATTSSCWPSSRPGPPAGGFPPGSRIVVDFCESRGNSCLDVWRRSHCARFSPAGTGGGLGKTPAHRADTGLTRPTVGRGARSRSRQCRCGSARVSSPKVPGGRSPDPPSAGALQRSFAAARRPRSRAFVRYLTGRSRIMLAACPSPL